MNKNILLYLVLLVFGLIAPFLFPAFKLQISFLWILIILAMTWDVQGGQMGYNTFGNILFFGIGMYLCAGIQIGMFFPLAEWTVSGGEKTFVHTPTQYFQGFFVGLVAAGIVPAIVAGLIGYGILGLRGHYFAICTLALGIAAGEIAGGIELIGAGQGMTSPPWPKNIGDTELRSEFFYYICFVLMVATFVFLRWAYTTRFGLVLNAIRDNEDKAEAMGIYTMRYKIIGWMVSAFFVGIAGGLMGNMIGYIEPVEKVQVKYAKYLKLLLSKNNKLEYEDICQLLKEFHGKCPVMIEYHSDNASGNIPLNSEYDVSLHRDLLEAIDKNLGPGKYKIQY